LRINEDDALDLFEVGEILHSIGILNQFMYKMVREETKSEEEDSRKTSAGKRRTVSSEL